MMSTINECPLCKSSNIKFHSKIEPLEVKGETFDVLMEYYECLECKEEFMTLGGTDPFLHAYNQYREKHDMLFAEEIKSLRKRYTLTQDEFCMLIGIGKASLSRYENGSLQTEGHDSLIKTFRNPENVLDIVKSKKADFPTERYEKLLDIINEQKHCHMLSRLFQSFKSIPFPGITSSVNAVAAYLLQKSFAEEEEGLCPMKLQKFLYYAQGLYASYTEKPLFSIMMVAWPYGPLVEDVYQTFKDYGKNPISELPQGYNVEDVPEELVPFLEKFYTLFRPYSAIMLSEWTHKEAPWTQTPMNDVISFDKIRGYFKKIADC